MDKKKRILIVDDDDMLRRLIIDRLAITGKYDLIEASNATEALREIPIQKPDLLILDYMLPDLSGLEILECLLKKDITIPSIMVTAYDSAKLRSRIASFAVNSIFRKPLELKRLVETVDRLLI